MVAVIFGSLMFGAGVVVGFSLCLFLSRQTRDERARLSDAPVVVEISR